MKILRQSTGQVVQFGPMVAVGDGATLQTGLATAMDNASTGLRVSKDGAAFADRNDATVPSYDAMGCYRITLSTTDTNTLGLLRVIFEEVATCLPHWEDYFVVGADFYDAVMGTDALSTNATVVAMNGSTITAAAIATGAIDAGAFAAGAINAAAIATDAIGADELAADAVTEIQSGLATAAALTTTDGKVDTVDANVDLILADTGTDGVVLSAATANQVADALLKRDWTSVSGEAARSALNALRFLRNKWSVSGATLTVTEEDDTTPAWTSAVTTDAAADPVTGSDPA